MNPAATADSIPVARVRLWPLVMATGLLTGAADFLFWHSEPGISLGIFVALLAVGVLFHRTEKRIGGGTWLAFILLLGACGQCGIEICFTNVCVLIALLLVLAGGSFYSGLPAGWRRWLRQGWAVLACVDRLPWLATTWLAQRPAVRERHPSFWLARSFAITAPALILIVVFAALFSNGNLIFRHFLERFEWRALDWLTTLDWSQWRLMFWLAAASVILAFLRPSGAAATVPRRELGLWQRSDTRLAWLQSLLVLAALNALFAMVNTIDVFNLWMQSSTPSTVDPKEFVHAGVNSLIVATVLAAIVLAAMFQQSREVTGSRALRALGYLWILQNILLAASVFRRDWLYVAESHLLTEKRVYVLCFLSLVVAGYGFLAVHVQRGGGLGRLLWRNTIATFILFYTMQFLDVGGLVSRWCARKSLDDLTWGFNVTYWSTQGPPAWPAILAVAHARAEHPQRDKAREYLAQLRSALLAEDDSDWRAWQWRGAANRAQVLADAPPK